MSDFSTGVLNRRRVYHANNRGKHSTYDFNCWGATLYVLGDRDRLKWVDHREMDEFLVEETEPIYRPAKKGDILTVSVWGRLTHTAVYMGNGRYFHKRGSNSAEITNLAGVRKIYRGEYKWRRLI